jgi:hypothetical protein
MDAVLRQQLGNGFVHKASFNHSMICVLTAGLLSSAMWFVR